MSVTAWASFPGRHLSTINGATEQITIPYMDEAVFYALPQERIVILLTAFVSIKTAEPVIIHLAHRRHVKFEDRTQEILSPTWMEEDALSIALGDRLSVGNEDNTIIFSPGGLGEEPIKAQLPKMDDINIDAISDIEIKPTYDTTAIPFTSVGFGPLTPSDIPHILRLAIQIEQPSFSELIRRANRFGVKHYYNIEGPDLVSSDIGHIDLFALPVGMNTVYSDLFRMGVVANRVAIKSYGVRTFDALESDFVYSRVYSWSEQVFEDRLIQPKNSIDFMANEWFSRRGDFLIQRVSLSSGSNKSSE